MSPGREEPPFPSRLGRYRVTGELGRGGMGVVLRGEDPRLGRPVALKLLPPHLVADAEARARFEREARAASALDHPAICTIYEIGDTDDGRAFIAMALYEGVTLRERLAWGALPVSEAVSIARQVAEGLARAHEHDIVHRDIKPANILVTPRGDVRILDFGVAKLAGEAGLTGTGVPIGTLAYMAPEQASASGDVDARADLWALGVLLHEMLAGRSPFERSTPAATVGAILAVDLDRLDASRRDVPEALATLVQDLVRKDPEERPGSAADVARVLGAIEQGRDPGATGGDGGAHSGGTGASVSQPPARYGLIRIAAAAVVVLVLGGGGWWWAQRSGEVAWARDEAIPEVLRLVGENHADEAAALALRAEAVLGSDPLLDPLWPRITTPLRIRTEPAGARVSMQPYGASSPDAAAASASESPSETREWIDLGTTPLDLERVPLGASRFRLTLDGYEPIDLVRSFLSLTQQTELAHAGFDYQNDASYAIDVRLTPAGALPEGMVRVAGGLYATVPLLGFAQLDPRMIPEFYIDRTEVTNAAFAEFVQAGGYTDERWWRDAVADADPEVGVTEALGRFVDATGRPGPAGWTLGAPPEDLADHPVTGVSWFEATAYCQWRGAALPTLYHWARAALPSAGAWVPFSPTLAARSNLDGTGTVPVGSLDAISIAGAQDMLGNAREWTSTASIDGRYLLGASWADPEYFVSDSNAPSPWHRTDGDGFRCAQFGDDPVPPALLEPLTFPTQVFSARPTLSDDVFEATARFYAYDPAQPLGARVDSTATHPDGWSVEWVSVETPYGDRLPIRIHRPATPPPWESVVFFPGGNVLRSPEIEPIELVPLDFVLRSGRALVEPVYHGAFRRNDGRTLERWGNPTARTDLLRHWVQDLGRTLDYIEQDPDLRSNATSYLGLSLGAVVAPNLLAFEPRFRALVLYSGGFGVASSQASIDAQSGLADRVRAPVLLLVGDEDIVSPVEPHKTAFLGAFGSPDSAKVMRVFDAGHWPLPMNDVIRETVDFLDRYGG
ncbi:MAG: protein kinase [Gemmatimonadetes bacterium]|nr:protein kinase [Gemmatimonadota bacterium]